MRNDVELTRELMRLIACNVQCTAFRIYSDEKHAKMAEDELKAMGNVLGVFLDIRRRQQMLTMQIV